MEDGIENFPLRLSREGRQKVREGEEKGLREEASSFSGPSQRVIVVCLGMSVSYFKGRWSGHKAEGLQAVGDPPCLVLGLENEVGGRGERERIQ